MSGHNKWSTIKHKKAREDAKRGKIFSKLIREITVAARDGGGDIDSNPQLRSVVQAAKAVNMPADNIDRAIRRGTGELPGVSYESVTYEGYGPGGVAVLIEVLTDNRNRTTAELRHLFSKYGGNLGERGCVSWLFNRTGQLMVPKQGNPDDEAMLELALESGADDIDSSDDEYYRVTTAPDELHQVKESLEGSGVTVETAQLEMEPSTQTAVEGGQAERMLKLMEVFDDHDDVQNVWANFDIDDEVLAQV